MKANSELIIRTAVEDDFKAVYDFMNHLEETVFDVEVLKEAFIRNINNPEFNYLIAETDHISVGYLSCHSQRLLHHGGQKIGEIQEMYVRPQSRGLGIGKKLIAELREWANNQGIVQLEVTSGNKRILTHKFYEREGFIHSHKKFTLNLK